MEATQSIDARVGYAPAFIRQSDIERLDTLRICPDPEEERILELTDYISSPADYQLPPETTQRMGRLDIAQQAEHDPVLFAYSRIARHDQLVQQALVEAYWQKMEGQYLAH